ncbi:hypothetical protein LQL77_30620 [Rhodococcus cerastii]|nr:hypothetical protein [Rhodococcus cerastii]
MSGRTVAEVAAGLEVAKQTIYNLRGQELVGTGPKPGLSSIESAELAAARRRITELETELAIARRSTEWDCPNCRRRWRPQRRFEAIEVMAKEGLPGLLHG